MTKILPFGRDFLLIIKYTMQKQAVFIQGIEGSNHHLAAIGFFQDHTTEIIPCQSFRELFSRLTDEKNTLAMVAMENTLAGSLLANYTLLRQSGMTILGEYKMRISHQLMALKGQRISQISEIHSHPMALAQCEAFLLQYPGIRLVESEDTALSARIIAQESIQGRAAIASELASQLYDLEIVASQIETNPHNFTRFLVVGSHESVALSSFRAETDKSSIVFALPHESGSLSRILSMLSYFSLNLTKIQSLPVVGREWEYLFYVDFTFTDRKLYQTAMEAIRPLCLNLQLLGEYQTHESRIKYVNGEFEPNTIQA